MKKWVKKIVTFLLIATFSMSVDMPAFADENKNIILNPGEEYVEDLGNGFYIIHSLVVKENSPNYRSTLKSGEAHYYMDIYQSESNAKVGRAYLNAWYNYGDNKVYVTSVTPTLTRYTGNFNGEIEEWDATYSVSGGTVSGSKTAIITGHYYLRILHSNAVTVISKPEIEITLICNDNTISVMSNGVKG